MTETQQSYRIRGMDCAECAMKVEKGVSRLEGVEQARVDFGTGLLWVQGEVDAQALAQRVTLLGYGIEMPAAQTPTAAPVRTHALLGFGRFLWSRRETRLALAGGALLLLSLFIGLWGGSEGLVTAVQITALAAAGYPIARSALVNLWINRDFSINLLMTIAAVGAVLIGETTESATLIFLFAIAEALEGYTADRARGVLGELSALMPTQATRLSAAGEQVVAVEVLQPGDEILIRAGERIPMDGTVASGQSAVNQAPITGESMPVEKSAGSEVFAGSVNGSGMLTVCVTRPAAETTLQRVIRLIEEAQALRAPTQRFIDRFAQIYTPLMVGLAALVALVPPLVWQQPFFNPAAGGTGWLYRALALLVIACPCALVISAPVTVVSALTAAARHGVLFKGGLYLELLAGVRAFAFDKTGTLTQGQPVVMEVRALDCDGSDSCAACDDLLAVAGALEKRSAHPLAQPVLAAAAARGVEHRYAPAQEVMTLAGSGLTGQVNGRAVTVGSHTLFEQLHPHDQALCERIGAVEARGHTAMLVGNEDGVRGFISVSDAPRPESAQALQELAAMGKETVMLTGDNPAAAQAVGTAVGVRRIRAGLLPQDKVTAVREMTAQFGTVAMVGDGINDAPALAAAAVGIAMGGAASAQAMETADVVLMGSDLRQLPYALRLSDFARGLIRQNVVISLATKLVFVGLTFAGITSLWLAVAADMGVSLAVTFNGMRAGRFQ